MKARQEVTCGEDFTNHRSNGSAVATSKGISLREHAEQKAGLAGSVTQHNGGTEADRFPTPLELSRPRGGTGTSRGAKGNRQPCLSLLLSFSLSHSLSLSLALSLTHTHTLVFVANTSFAFLNCTLAIISTRAPVEGGSFCVYTTAGNTVARQCR